MFRLIASILAAWVIAMPGWAQEPPSQEQMIERIEAVLPPGWSIRSYTEIASKNSDDPVKPVVSLRFEAMAANAEELFLPFAKTIGPFEVVVSAMAPGTPRKLYGTAQFEYSAGQWNGSPTIENPVDDLGNPASSFGKPILVLGSDQYNEMVQTIQTDQMNGVKSDFETKMAAIQSEYDARIEALQSQKEREVKAAQDSLNEAIKTAKAQHTEAMSTLTAENAAAIAAARSKHAEAMAAIERDQQAAMSKAMSDGETKIQKIKSEAAAKIGQIEAQVANEVARISEGFATRLTELKKVAAESKEVINIQNDVIAAKEKIIDNETWLIQMDSQAAELRRKVVDSLQGVWTGRGACTGDDLFAFTGNFAQFEGGNLAGEITITSETDTGLKGFIGKPQPATLVMVSEANEQPVRLQLSTNINDNARDLLFMKFDMRADGSLAGVSGNKDKCQVVMSK